jgi:hypothetical protein
MHSKIIILPTPAFDRSVYISYALYTSRFQIIPVHGMQFSYVYRVTISTNVKHSTVILEGSFSSFLLLLQLSRVFLAVPLLHFPSGCQFSSLLGVAGHPLFENAQTFRLLFKFNLLLNFLLPFSP